MMRSHYVTGGGGTQIHLVETGQTAGPSILFLHGLAQSWRVWSRQLSSDLQRDFRLVAMDLRGHGGSEKPTGGYGDSRLWAEDVHAAIETLSLEQPILCGWSYGPLLILDYIRHFGEEAIGGLDIVGGVTQLGSDEAVALLTPEFLALVPGFFSSDPADNRGSLGALLHLCFRKLSPQELSEMLENSLAVPTYVRQGMFARTLDNDDLLQHLRTPVLISHGARDRVVKPVAAERHRAAIPHAQVHLVPEAGHGFFWDDPPTFNQRLRAFATSSALS
jgi:non-heme chloroperoxidase